MHIESEVLVKKVLLDIKNIDFVNNPGVLSVIEHKSDLGKCIEWNQCEFSIESDDQEWAIVKDSKNHTGTSNGGYIN